MRRDLVLPRRLVTTAMLAAIITVIVCGVIFAAPAHAPVPRVYHPKWREMPDERGDWIRQMRPWSVYETTTVDQWAIDAKADWMREYWWFGPIEPNPLRKD